jgi:hypothetical protein
VTISAVGTETPPSGASKVAYAGSVCFATDSNGYIWEYSTPNDVSGLWYDTGGRNVVQIAASYGNNANPSPPMVYALTTDGKVWEWGAPQKGNAWQSLGSGFVEISAERTYPGFSAVPLPIGAVYAIAASSHNLHELTLYKDRNLGGDYTAITAEGDVALGTGSSYKPGVYADPSSFDPWAYDGYLSSTYTGWYDMNGPQMLAQSTPIFA